MAITEKYLLGSQTTVLNTSATLANNALVASSAYDNTPGQTGDGYTEADLELAVTFGTAPTAGTAASIWFLRSQDGTNYEDGSSSVTPARSPDLVIPVNASTSAQRIIRAAVLPPGKITVLLKNDGTGQSMSSGWTLKLRPITRQGI